MTTTDLGTFDNRDVLGTTISVTNAGDGLSQNLAIDPVVLHHGDIVYVVLETVVDKVTHKIIKDTDCLTRDHTLKAGTATIVPAEVVKAMIDAQAAKLQLARLAAERAKDEAKGIVALPGTDDRPTTDADDFYDPEADIPGGDEPTTGATLSSITGARAAKKAAAKKAAPAKKRGT